MTPSELLSDLRTRGVILRAQGDRLHVEAPRGVITPALRTALASHKAELLALVSNSDVPGRFDIESSRLAAAKFVNTVIGDIWVVADDDALSEHPDIIRGGLPVFYFSEVGQLAGRTAEDLQAIRQVKAVFPTGRVLQ